MEMGQAEKLMTKFILKLLFIQKNIPFFALLLKFN